MGNEFRLFAPVYLLTSNYKSDLSGKDGCGVVLVRIRNKHYTTSYFGLVITIEKPVA